MRYWIAYVWLPSIMLAGMILSSWNRWSSNNWIMFLGMMATVAIFIAVIMWRHRWDP